MAFEQFPEVSKHLLGLALKSCYLTHIPSAPPICNASSRVQSSATLDSVSVRQKATRQPMRCRLDKGCLAELAKLWAPVMVAGSLEAVFLDLLAD